MRLTGRLRWRLARWIAPAPVIAEPLGDGQVFILIRFDGDMWAWVQADRFRLKMTTDVEPIGTPHATANWIPSTSGRFVGTVKG